MIKKLIVTLVVSVMLGTGAGALIAYSNFKETLNSLPVSKNNQALDLGILPDVSKLAEPTSPVLVENGNGVKTLNLKKAAFIVLYGPIMENGNEIAAHIREASQKNDELYLLIDSPGGNVITGGAIVSAIEASPVPVNTVCLQLCASMAAMIHQYGTQRYVVNRSLLMFHDASGGVMGSFPQIMSQMNTFNRFVNKMFAHTAKRSGQQYKDFVSKLGSEVWIDGEDAVQQKYSDGLVNVIYREDDAINPAPQALLESRESIKKKLLGLEYIKK